MVIKKEIRVGACTPTFSKSPHGRFLYIKVRARRFLVSANHYKENQEAALLTPKLYHHILFLRVLTTGDYINYHNHKG